MDGSPPASLDYLAHLTAESTAFRRAIESAAPGTRVPTCPDWDADDLLWHLGEVQWFWGTIVREGVAGPQAEALKPLRPGDRAGLLAFFDQSSAELARILAVTPPVTPAWTWSEDHTVGFIRRRQAHETLIHRLDAELTAGARTAMDSALASDGTDEALRVMYGGLPDWGGFTPDRGGPVRVRASDTGYSWLVTPGRFAGTDPGDGTSYDEPALDVAPGDSGATAAATITGGAADLDCWLWGRPPAGDIERSGDAAALAGLDTVIASGIQ